jgi:hypothetical protein
MLWYALLWCATLLATLPAPVVWRVRVARLLAISVPAVALIAPWLALVGSQTRPRAGAAAMNLVGNAGYNGLPQALLWAGANRTLVALALGVALVLLERRRRGAVIVLWWGSVVLSAKPVWVGLPYLSFITNETVVITLFAPAALLISGGVTHLAGLAQMNCLNHHC